MTIGAIIGPAVNYLLPALIDAVGVLKQPTVQKFTALALNVFLSGYKTAPRLKALNAEIQRLVDESVATGKAVDPGPEYWADLDIRGQNASDVITEEANKRREAEGKEPLPPPKTDELVQPTANPDPTET